MMLENTEGTWGLYMKTKAWTASPQETQSRWEDGFIREFCSLGHFFFSQILKKHKTCYIWQTVKYFSSNIFLAIFPIFCKRNHIILNFSSFKLVFGKPSLGKHSCTFFNRNYGLQSLLWDVRIQETSDFFYCYLVI